MAEVNLAVKGDECNCGRRASVLHCPSCGSGRIYARQNRVHKMLDGSSRLVDTEYRCMKCGHLFIAEERKDCEAPPPTRKLAQQRAKVLAEELIRTNPERAKQILETGGDVAQELKKEPKKSNGSGTVDPDVRSWCVPIDEIRTAFGADVHWDDSVAVTAKEDEISRRVRILLAQEFINLKAQGREPTATAEAYITLRLAGEVYFKEEARRK